jgi:hypothetical protein
MSNLLNFLELSEDRFGKATNFLTFYRPYRAESRKVGGNIPLHTKYGPRGCGRNYEMTAKAIETETEYLQAEVQNPEDGFLAFLMDLSQDELTALDEPVAEDVLGVADQLRTCAADRHFSSAARWTVLDVAAHIGKCSGDGRMPTDWVRNGLMHAHAEYLRSAGSVRTTSCLHCDVPPPTEPELSPEAAAAYERALQAVPKLRAVADVVEILRLLVRPTDQLCYGCIWDSIIKPLVRPWVGWGRGYPPKPAKDPDNAFPRFINVGEAMREADPRIPAETETEKYLFPRAQPQSTT